MGVRAVALAGALACGLAVPGTARAAATTRLVALNAVDTGWYSTAAVQGRANANYLTGYLPDDDAAGEYRSFFVFDLAGVRRPIVGAALRLGMPLGGFASPSGSEGFAVFDVATAVARLRSRRGGAPVFADLGSGERYGTGVARGEGGGPVLSVPLSLAAIAALNAADGAFAVGGALMTLGDGSAPEHLFAFSSNMDVRQLVLTTTPVPAALPLLGTALLGLWATRRRSRGRADRAGAASGPARPYSAASA